MACQQLVIILTKLLCPLVKHWRFAGLRVILYVDDGICVGSTGAECGSCQENHLRRFEESRLCAEQGKSQIVPRQAGM